VLYLDEKTKIVNAKGDDKFFGIVALRCQHLMRKLAQKDSHMVFMIAMNVRKAADDFNSAIRVACTVSGMVLLKFNIFTTFISPRMSDVIETLFCIDWFHTFNRLGITFATHELPIVHTIPECWLLNSLKTFYGHLHKARTTGATQVQPNSLSKR
jgi:hypothetical protein